MNQLILASSSPHRAGLLSRLRLPFQQVSPEIDETPRHDEAPHELAARLAVQKAQTVSGDHPECCVIGSDQVVVHQHQLVGKPGNEEKASACLNRFSGEIVQFLTAVAVIQSREVVGHAVVESRVTFRKLAPEEITRYIKADKPFDCAGSFRAEALGISLFESVFSQDPTALIGLPLIETARLLRLAGYQLP